MQYILLTGLALLLIGGGVYVSMTARNTQQDVLPASGAPTHVMDDGTTMSDEEHAMMLEIESAVNAEEASTTTAVP